MKNKYTQLGVLKPAHKPNWFLGRLSWYLNLIVVTLALFALTACNGDAMDTCQQTHSYETCVYTLR